MLHFTLYKLSTPKQGIMPSLNSSFYSLLLFTSKNLFLVIFILQIVHLPPTSLMVLAQFDEFDLLDEILFEQAREDKEDREYLDCVHELDPHCYYVDKQTFAEIQEGERNTADDAFETIGGGGGGRRKKRQEIVNCEADGSCISQDESNAQNGGRSRDTCCGICKSCTFEGCCHCSFTDPEKYCPMPGWRAPDYTGTKGRPAIQPRKPKNNHVCMDIVVLSGLIHRYYQALRARRERIQIQNLVTEPYIREDWAYVVGTRHEDNLDVRPNDGFILQRTMDHNGERRTEILERNIRPQDLRTRYGGFTPGQRAGFFRTHNGVNATDQMGHILGNTMGGPNTLANCFPQHVASNNNAGGVDPNAPNWVATENAIREFLRGGSLSRYVQFRVHLIYPSTTTGRPSEIVWTAIFMDGSQIAQAPMGGRLLNDGSPHSNICNAPGGR